jgi:hypothetical protein
LSKYTHTLLLLLLGSNDFNHQLLLELLAAGGNVLRAFGASHLILSQMEDISCDENTLIEMQNEEKSESTQEEEVVREAFGSPEMAKKKNVHAATTSKLPVSRSQNGGSFRTSSGSTPKRMRPSTAKKPPAPDPTQGTKEEDGDNKQNETEGVEQLNAAEYVICII